MADYQQEFIKVFQMQIEVLTARIEVLTQTRETQRTRIRTLKQIIELREQEIEQLTGTPAKNNYLRIVK